MKPQLLLGLFRDLITGEGLNQVSQHANAKPAHLLTLFGKMETEIVVILGVDVLIDSDLLHELYIAVVDQRAQNPQAEIRSARGRIKIPRALANESDSEEIPSLGGDHVVIPQQLHVFGDANPLIAARTILQLNGLLIHLGSQRIRIHAFYKFQEGAIANIVSLKEKNQALHRAIEILAACLLGELLENRVHSLGNLEILRLDKSLEETLDTRRDLAQGRLSRLANPET